MLIRNSARALPHEPARLALPLGVGVPVVAPRVRVLGVPVTRRAARRVIKLWGLYHGEGKSHGDRRRLRLMMRTISRRLLRRLMEDATADRLSPADPAAALKEIGASRGESIPWFYRAMIAFWRAISLSILRRKE
jgi:hypothetical protein